MELISVDLIDILLQSFQDPVTYSILFFIYVVLAAIILPIPVEIGLFNPNIHPVLLIGILALGKGVGAYIVFNVSQRVRKRLKTWSIGADWKITKKMLSKLETFVINYGHYGLFIIMGIPLMVDSISLYLFSLLNPTKRESKLDERKFVLINIAAGSLRGLFILVIFYLIGVKLV